MTKTLTEQWRDGTLPEGYYYITSKKWGMLIDRYRDQINDCGHKWRGFDNCQGVVEEVLAPVPSYDEWHKVKDLGLRPDYTDHIEKWEDCARLTKKLEIATKALKDIKVYSQRDWDEYNCMECADKALKEMEGVK